MRGDQLARQWRLIQRLARSRYGVGLDEIAADLDCTRRTIYRDLDALMYAGFPVTSEKRDNRVYYRLLEDFQLGDAPFTPDELLALAFSEDVLQALEGTVFHDSIRSALAKIRASLGPDLAAFLSRFRDAFQVMPGPHKQYAEVRDVIRTLNEAVLERRTVRIAYTTARTGETATRSLDPYRVWYRSGALYVIGHDHKRDEIRTFAIDRIREPVLTEDAFEVAEDFDFDALTAGSFGVVAEAPESVCIRFGQRRALYVQEHVWHESQRVTPADGGAVDLHLQVGTGDELRQWILSFGADALVLAPDHLRKEVARELDAARARYEGP